MELLDRHPEKYKETNLFIGCNFKLKVFEVVHTLHSVLKLHWHDYIEILYIMEGNATINIGQISYDVCAGDILFVNSRQLHSGYSKNNTFVKYYAIVIDQHLYPTDSNDPHYRKFILPYMDGTRMFPVKPDGNSACCRKLKDYLKVIIQEFKSAQPGYEIKIKASLNSLIIEIFRNYLPIDAVDTDAEESTEDAVCIKNLISHIYLTCPKKMGIRDAADYVKLSPYYFCKVFKKVTNQTFIDFLNMYKVSRAEEFLLYTNDSVSDIASELGFCNTNYFDKVFRKVKGCSPSTFRRQTNI